MGRLAEASWEFASITILAQEMRNEADRTKFIVRNRPEAATKLL